MRFTVGAGSCGIAAGAQKVMNVLGGFAETSIVGCIGACYLEPIVNAEYNGQTFVFVKVGEKAAKELGEFFTSQTEETVALPAPLKRLLISEKDAKLIENQPRIALYNCGVINPESIDEYISRGGYEGFLKYAAEKTPAELIEEIKLSGLAGRGGAGFPTWFKWDAAAKSKGAAKYVICNADEGDPGAFMDRAVIEGDPHAVIEGMLTCAYAIGGTEGVVYVRAEYPLAVSRLKTAVNQAREKGFLGENIKGTGMSFDIKIKMGAGAFVCGEETALIASLEGERGMPRLKPPFPAQKGYNALPSNINNVETYANVPFITRNGGAAFAAKGTPDSRGTKVFALTGKIKNGGLVEAEMGMTISDIVFGAGGGIKNGKKFKAVQMGGPSGGCIPEYLSDTPIDYKAIGKTGAIMGSGGMVVMDEDTCMVDMARFFLDFTCKESCGKCTHCRIGTKRMLEILTRITEGNGRDGDIEALLSLGQAIKDGALCGLGQTAPNPVLTTIRYFKEEYEDHILRHKCTAKSCKPFIRYEIIADKCKNCGKCAKSCPVNAITKGESAYIIDKAACIACGKCRADCKFAAVNVTDRAEVAE
ncbi:NADH-quinone oxidoreductase subunit F [Clostridia bacterium]|nr:NADH-quinone oxidoreductase subunit F [Clostridia bacterium]